MIPCASSDDTGRASEAGGFKFKSFESTTGMCHYKGDPDRSCVREKLLLDLSVWLVSVSQENKTIRFSPIMKFIFRS